MHITAAIATLNRPGHIRRAVSSVLENDHPDFDLVVIDQSNSDATRQVLADIIAAHPNFTYVHTTRVGRCAANNAAIAHATGELIAFTDDDCAVPTNWLRQVEEAFIKAPDVDLLFGQVMIPPEMNGVPGIIPALSIAKKRRLSRRHGFRIYGMGANFAARRRLFEQIGGYDEVLGGGGPLRCSEDFDLEYRAFRAGLVTLLDPNVRVDHYGLRTTSEWPQTLTTYGVGDGGFYMKHLRCGDLYAGWLMLRILFQQSIRVVIKPLVGRGRHRPEYLRGILTGAYKSFRFGVDPTRRIYTTR